MQIINPRFSGPTRGALAHLLAKRSRCERTRTQIFIVGRRSPKPLLVLLLGEHPGYNKVARWAEFSAAFNDSGV